MPEANTQPTVAYFCMEFALRDDVHIYSGGLGVLAGDFLLEADQQSFPVVGIGLLYSSVYKQALEGNEITNTIEQISPQQAGLIPVVDETGERVIVTIPFQEKLLKIQVWKKEYQHLNLYLLDTNLVGNTTEFQNITDRLYSGDKEHRLAQELVLGIGGMRLLKALKFTPQFIHMNEGHAAFCAFEHIADLMGKLGMSFNEALEKGKEQLRFTNHTLIPAGNDNFTNELVTVFLASFAEERALVISKLLDLGNIPGSSLFSMTFLGLRTAGKTNAVSEYHAQKATAIWPDYRLLSITNGIFLPRWYAAEKNQVWNLNEKAPPSPLDFWHAHQESKDKLVKYIKAKTGKTFSSNGLIITWSRRFVQYKRPEVLFWLLERLEHILNSANLPVYLVFSGKGHTHDQQAQDMIKHVYSITQNPIFSESIAYIPNYNLEVAEYLVQGSDVWLNTPIEGFEACGTSGMKAGVNGVLQCSTNDGWVREVSWENMGWILDNDHISESLYATIEKEIIPLFLDRDQNAIPQQWLQRMIDTAQTIREKYSATRMLQDYKEKLYIN
ncbi:MAG: alpha-glucan family phosphorylase [Patescibacteria group bacterium]